MEIIILMGLQASGKSTFYRTHFAATYEYVSKDLLRRSKHKNKDQEQAEHIESAKQFLLQQINLFPPLMQKASIRYTMCV